MNFIIHTRKKNKYTVSNEKVLRTILFLAIYVFYISLSLNIPHEIFRDRDSYIWYAKESLLIIETRYQNDILSLIFNEPLFLLLNYCFSWLSPEYIPLIWLYIVISTFLFFLYKQSANLYMLILGFLLFVTISYTFHYQHVILRQALATSFLMFAIVNTSNYREYTKIIFYSFIVSFIHSSFFLITLIVLLVFILRNLNEFIRYIILLLTYSLTSILILPLSNILGFRQAQDLLDYEHTVGGGSFIVWFIVFIYLFINGNKKNKVLYDCSMAFLLLFLTLYFFNPIVGRLMCSFVPFIILLLVSKYKISNIFLCLFLCLSYGYLMYNGLLFNLSFNINNINDIIFLLNLEMSPL